VDGLARRISGCGLPVDRVRAFRIVVEAARTLRAPNTMKHTLRCHGFGDAGEVGRVSPASRKLRGDATGQNCASPQGVAARIVTGFVARLANIPDIGCTSLRAIANSGSHRPRVSLC
jgi:hypothetical protein